MLVYALALLPACTSMDPIHFNLPPTAPEVSITPAAPDTESALTAVIEKEGADAEDDGLSYVYTWTRNGVLQAFNGPTILAADTVRGDVWVLSVTATDGEWTSGAATAEVTILNTAPTVASVAIAPLAPLTDDSLSVSYETFDLDDDTVSANIRWFADEAEVGSLADALAVSASETTSGQVWRVEVTPTDGTVAGAMLSAEVKIDNTAPVLTGVFISPSEAYQGSTLSAGLQGRDDADDDVLVVTYDWMLSGRVVYSETTAGISYYVGDLEKGYVFSVSAQASDGFLTSDVVTSDTVTVLNSAPTATSALLSPEPAYEASTLTCTGLGADDIDDDPVDFDYDWTVNGVEVSVSGDTLDGDSFSRGSVVTCTATPDDGDATGTAQTSNAVTISNTLPLLDLVDLSTSAPTKVTGISCTPSGWSDDDGDSAAYTYAWYVNGTSVGTSTSVSGSTLTRGVSVYVAVTPYDSYGSGTPVNSDTVIVQNSLPTISSVGLTPSPMYTDSIATCTPSGYADLDGDTAAYTYAWYLNGVAIGASTSLLIGSTRFDKADRVYCAVTPSDGYEDGALVKSSIVTVSNSAPVVDAVLASSSTIAECDEIQLDGSATADADDDALTYAWSITSKPAASSLATTDFDTSTSVAPYVVVDAAGSFTFQLSASDGSASSTDTVAVTVTERASNEAPVAVGGDDESFAATTTCVTSGSGTYCPPCSTEYVALDASTSSDGDGDPLRYTWSYSTYGGGSVSLDSTTSETPTLTFGSLGTSYGSTATSTATVTLTVRDCAGGRDTDAVTISYSCTGI